MGVGNFNSSSGEMSKEVRVVLKPVFCFKKIALGILLLMVLQFSAVTAYGLSYANQSNNPDVVYELFPTQNIWTFLKLNTRDGRIAIVQFDVNKSDRMEYDLNTTPFVEEENAQNGRFTLYPTSNIYNFILLDQIDGRVWQVQWSDKKEQRLVFQIYRYPLK